MRSISSWFLIWCLFFLFAPIISILPHSGGAIEHWNSVQTSSTVEGSTDGSSTSSTVQYSSDSTASTSETTTGETTTASSTASTSTEEGSTLSSTTLHDDGDGDDTVTFPKIQTLATIEIPKDGGNGSNVPIWAVVVISFLIAVAAGTTVLYILRYISIKRRQSDRRLLLAAGISQEGFFLGSQVNYDHAL